MTPPRDPRLLVVALGSRALRHATDTPDDWVDALEPRLGPLAELIAAGFRLVVTHGARPEIAEALHRVDLARRAVPPLPLDRTIAAAQGMLGYAIQQALANLCRARGLATPVVALVTRAVVEAFDTGPGPLVAVGPPYPLTRARQLARASGGAIVEEDGLGRRAAPARRPLSFLETPVIAALAAASIVPVAAGMGGVPVVVDGHGHRGVEAVVDPDLGAAVLATELRADRLLFLTGVEQAMVGFGTPRAIGIADLTLGDARALLDAGELAPATIGAKVAAGLDFVEAGGREAIITAPAFLRAALGGHAGTRITA